MLRSEESIALPIVHCLIVIFWYSIQCGKANVADCLQHLEQQEHDAFIHKKMLRPDQSDDEDDEEEDRVDISMVRDAFHVLVEG